MNKKQALATILAGLITLNTLGGCTSKNTEISSSSSTSIEEVLEDNYRISTIMASKKTLEDGTTFTVLPEDYILIGSLGYKVEQKLTHTSISDAQPIYNENGQIIDYIAPFGGKLIGNKVYTERTYYKTVTGYEAKEILDNYLNEQTLKLQK